MATTAPMRRRARAARERTRKRSGADGGKRQAVLSRTGPSDSPSAKPRRKSSDAANAETFPPAPVPRSRKLSVLRAAAAGCRACPLWRSGTQTVFGEGPQRARVIFVGEQPGDREDRAGQPFVGPAGRLLDRALAEAHVDRAKVYVTNAVKHFKWEPRGPRRLHKKPNAREIAACRPWLEAEIAALVPELVVCLGATAAQSVFGRPVRVLQERGKLLESPLAARTLVTVHPSALLRLPDSVDAEEAFASFVADLRHVAPFTHG